MSPPQHTHSLAPTPPRASQGGWGWLHYADWVFATPLLLVDLGMLCHMEAPELLFICVCDALMIVAGYAGFVATDPRAIWPLYTFSESLRV